MCFSLDLSKVSQDESEEDVESLLAIPPADSPMPETLPEALEWELRKRMKNQKVLRIMSTRGVEGSSYGPSEADEEGLP